MDTSVIENGIGMPGCPTLAESGLGSSIVDALARKLNASVEVGTLITGQLSRSHMRNPLQIHRERLVAQLKAGAEVILVARRTAC
jgi:hypothetical protein